MSTPMITPERKLATPLSPEGVCRFRVAWKAVAAARAFTAQDMAAYCLLTARPANKAFTPVSNPGKLAHGQAPFGSARKAWKVASLAMLLPRREGPMPKLSAFPSLDAWRAANKARPVVLNANLLQMFSPAVHTLLAERLGELPVADMDTFRTIEAAGRAVLTDTH